MKNLAIILTLVLNVCTVSVFAKTVRVNNAASFKSSLSADTIILTADFVLTDAWHTPNLSNKTIDGKGHAITLENNISLFNHISKTTIQNIRLVSAKDPGILTIAQESNDVFHKGTLANEATDSNILNCICETSLDIYIDKKETGHIGGIVGKSTRSSIRQSVFFNGSIKVEIHNNGNIDGYVGNICGFADTYSNIADNLVINSKISIEGHKVKYGYICGNWGYDLRGNTIFDDESVASFRILDLENITPRENVSVEENHIALHNQDEQSYLLINSTSKDVTADINGKLLCLNNRVGKLELGKNTIQSGYIYSSSLIIHDGCLIGEEGIGNSGEILYFRRPSVWVDFIPGAGPDGKGWESICLPFDAQLVSIQNNDSTIRYPFGTQGEKVSYWLKSYAGIQESVVLFQTATEIKKNIPYIISLPGENWGKNSLSNYTLCFRGKGPIKQTNKPAISPETENLKLKFKGNPNSTRIHKTCYILNATAESAVYSESEKGEAFLLRQEAPLNSFRATFEVSETVSPAAKLTIGYGTATSLQQPVIDNGKEDLKIFTANGDIIIESESPQQIAIHSTNGALIRNEFIETGTSRISGLSSGVYLVAGQKVIL